MARPAGYLLSGLAWEDALKWRGLSLTEVAERADIPRPTLSSLLGGYHKASAPTAHRLAAALDVHAVTLFPGLSDKFKQAA